ncbi:ferritin-like fold-containing protein [Herbiconiux sp. SYSU D00978]|uniref:ferritin-like fold-containing protein n=1 Tax=Herbiconiux sp. SYSU D00978 TaxID=2812562 RepID=UPI001F604AA3|nr:ferritin-like fold-containing protein [Herbiconiux sp. SYSU D00978]
MTPAPPAYLGHAAYLHLSFFESVSQALSFAPTLDAKERMSRVAGLALEKHRRFVEEIERRGDDAPALMQPFAAGVDLFRYETRGNDWYEVLVTHYVTVGLLEEFFEQLAVGLGRDELERVRDILDLDSGLELVVDELRRAIEQNPLLGSRLALWGRRLVGDTLLLARAALTSTDAAPSEERLEPVFTELIAGHTRRMDALGLTA